MEMATLKLRLTGQEAGVLIRLLCAVNPGCPLPTRAETLSLHKKVLGALATEFDRQLAVALALGGSSPDLP